MPKTCDNCGRKLPATDADSNSATTVNDIQLQAEGYCPSCNRYGADGE